MLGTKQEQSGMKIPPLPESPASSDGWPVAPPPLITTPTDAAAKPGSGASDIDRARVLALEAELGQMRQHAHELEQRIGDLIEEIAARDVTIAEFENDTIQFRFEFQRRGDALAETKGLLDDSQARVELLEQRLQDALARGHAQSPDSQLQERLASMLETQTDMAERNRQLELELQQALEAQQELLMREARRDVQAAQAAVAPGQPEKLAEYEREVEFAKSLISNLESEVQGKESKIATLQAEVAALRNILRNVDGRAIEAAKRRLQGQ